MNFDILREQAKLQPHEVAKIVKVNRVTASQWLNGHTQPHRLLANRVQKFLDAVSKSVETGDLPVPPDLKGSERGDYINKVLVKHLRAAPAEAETSTHP